MKMLKHFRTSINSSSSVRMKTRFGAKDSLITNESGFAHQADSGKSRFDSVPKGQNMANAKYLRKRIALVAAAALGVGLVVAAPAFAGTTAVVTTTTTGTVTGATLISGTNYTGVSGTAITIPLLAANATGATNADTEIFTGTVLTNAAATAPTITSAITGNALAAGQGVPTVTAPTLTITFGATAASFTATQFGTQSFTPVQPGVYTFTANGNSTGPAVASAALTFYVGTQVDTATADANRAFAVQGSNITSSAAINLTSGTVLNGTANALATVRFANFAASTHYYVTVSGGTLNAVTNQATTPAHFGITQGGTAGYNFTNGSTLSGGVNFFTASGATAVDALDVQVTAASGTVTITVSTTDSTTGLSTTFATTGVVFAATSGLSTSLSTAYMAGPAVAAAFSTANLVSTAFTTTTNAVAYSAAKGTGTSTNKIADVEVILKNTSGAVSNGNTVTASITGSGLISVDTTAATANGTARSATSGVLTGANVAYVHINSDGTAGTGTVTISVTDGVTAATTVLGTKTVTSYGTNTAITATANYTIGKAGGAVTGTNAVAPAETSVATTPAVIVHLTDAAGNGVVGTVAEVSSDVTVVNSDTSGASCGADDGTVGSGLGYYNCQFTTAASATSGKTATLTFRTNPSGDGVTFLTATVPITIGGSVSTETIALDKTSYTPAQAMTVTFTGKDSAGNPVYDGAASPAVTSSKLVGGTLPGASQYVGGTKASGTNKLFAPAISGDFTLFATSGNTALTPLSVTATVTGGTTGGLSAADSAAIAAAKAAADAATAAVATLSTTVASLIASITAQIRALAAQIAKLLGKSGGTTPGLPKTGKKK
jgi:hypothetical protein